jgi:hypothetical protein
MRVNPNNWSVYRETSKTCFGCKSLSKDLPMKRFGIDGRSSSQGAQLQAAFCGVPFCAGGMTTDGFIRHARRARARLKFVDRFGLSSAIMGTPHGDGVSR